ncbi:hypothetical protein [Pyrococcus horikoshii]|uniref:Uncharacterized protein n=1 Tax=Pyrococcus horikoshii TaxID=53953 RepID=A0A832WJC1_PYRHR|nr:hypothetical protein [Pyrococcus horikoshii]HII60199.1 hypothetical protein [Pyrococcus horikoshii]
METIDEPVSIKMPDGRTKNTPKSNELTDLKTIINTEIYNNIKFYIRTLYENAATETDVILLKALWREIKRMMKINGIEIEKKEK